MNDYSLKPYRLALNFIGSLNGKNTLCKARMIGRMILFVAIVSLTPWQTVSSQDWQFETIHNSDGAAKHWIDSVVTWQGEPTMALAGNGKKNVYGRYVATFPVEKGQYYRFQTYYKTKRVNDELPSVLVRIKGLNGREVNFPDIDHPEVQREKSQGEWRIIRDTYLAQQTTDVRVELIYRFDADGEVYFGETSFDKTNKPDPRVVKVAAIHHKPDRMGGDPMKILKSYTPFIQAAADSGADIVVIPEHAEKGNIGDLKASQVAEPIPGIYTDYLGSLARENKIYIVAGLYEPIRKDLLYNSAVLLGPSGKIIGIYRKAGLTSRETNEYGIMPGDTYPVFDINVKGKNVRLGMMVCWDVMFPEITRTLAKKGAEIIMFPAAGFNTTVGAARAIENQLYIVAATFGNKSTTIFGPDASHPARKGEASNVLQAAQKTPEVLLHEIDLNQRNQHQYLGDLKNRIFHEEPIGQ